MSLSDSELSDRYEALYPGAVTDTLDEFGYERRTLPSSINPLTRDTQVAGIAFPLVGKPDPDPDYEQNIRRFLRMLGEAPEDSVLAYETNDEGAAHIGELTTTALSAAGCRGAVIAGGARDVRFILDQGFPVFCEYTTPKDAPPRWHLDDWGVPIRIGDVEVRPGDVLVGDVDGVACVPRGIAEEVLEHAEEMVETESEIRERVREGMAPLDAFEQYGEF
ncbi:MAG: RraA family protein [Haloarculaceae archaeon]